MTRPSERSSQSCSREETGSAGRRKSFSRTFKRFWLHRSRVEDKMNPTKKQEPARSQRDLPNDREIPDRSHWTCDVGRRMSRRRVPAQRSRRSVPALHLFEGVQTEKVRLHSDASASSASPKLSLMGRVPAMHADTFPHPPFLQKRNSALQSGFLFAWL